MPLRLDHLVYAVVDLDEAVETFEKLTGVRPVVGGRHVGLGTHNALVSLGPDAYLELLALDPTQEKPASPWLGIDAPSLPRFTTLCCYSTNLEGDTARAQAAGYFPGPLEECSRTETNGNVLRWRLAAQNHRGGFTKLPGAGLIPFLIDWGATTKPSTTAPTGCTLTALSAEHPELSSVTPVLEALGAESLFTTLRTGLAPRIVATLTTPKGQVTLGD